MRNFDSASRTYLSRWPIVEQSWVRGRLGQSLLLTGGSNHIEQLGEALCRQLLCEARATSLPCACRSCARTLADHPDLTTIRPDPRIKRSMVRDAVAGLSVPPLWGQAKIVWVTEADLLTAVAESYLLKHLEEPRSFVVFILSTTRPDRLMATIRSRLNTIRAESSAESGEPPDNPRNLLDRLPLTTESVISLTYWVRRQYQRDARDDWLKLWETLEDVHQHLELNGNADIALEALRRAWRRSPGGSG